MCILRHLSGKLSTQEFGEKKTEVGKKSHEQEGKNLPVMEASDFFL